MGAAYFDGRTLYVAQTTTGRLWAYEIPQPGVLTSGKGLCVANTLASLDSMAEADGTVVVAALRDVLVVRPDGSHDFCMLTDR